MIDVECLIIEIEKHECIWKTTCKGFMDRDAKRKSWIDVGLNMFENWETFSIKEQEEKIEKLKRKWKNIRDNYTRDVNESRRIVSGSEVPKKNKKYAYADVLAFLRPIVKRRKTTGSINHNMDHTLDVSSNDHETDVEGYSSTFEALENSVSKTQLSSNPKNKIQTTSFQDALLDAVTTPPLFFQTPPEIDDPDKLFLLSFLPHIKKLNDPHKMELKFQFFQSLRSITTQSTYQPQNLLNSPSNSSVYQHNTTPTFPYPYSYDRPIGSSTATTSYAFSEPLTQNSSYTGPPQTRSLEQSNSNQYVFN